jgi:hypothetical protein
MKKCGQKTLFMKKCGQKTLFRKKCGQKKKKGYYILFHLPEE